MSIGNLVGTVPLRRHPQVLLPLRAIRQPAFLYDASGRIAEANDLAEALAGAPLAGLTPGEVFGRFSARRPDGIPPLPREWPAMRALAGEEAVDVPFAVTTADGRTRHVLVTASPLRDRDQVTGALSIWQDVSALRATEEALRTRIESVRAIINTPTDMTLLLDADGTIVEINDTYAALLNRPAAELTGACVWEVMPPEVVGRRRERFEQAVASRETVRFEECRVGRTFDVIVEPVLSSAGEIVQVAIIARDITDRVRAEAERTRYAEQLARSNEELQRFAYVASHDLQEPLRSIVSFSQLLERRYAGQLDSDADEYLRFIIDGGSRMHALIQDLLQLSRVETEARPAAPTDPTGVVYRALRTLEGALGEAGGTVAVAEPLPGVMADPVQLEQVFTNLVSNAIKYRRPDVPLALAISARTADDMVEFSVADNGIGIEPEHFDRIFEMFHRLHTHDEFEGTGIGLAVVKRIVERHGGTVRVESAPGRGSTFLFTLPAE